MRKTQSCNFIGCMQLTNGQKISKAMNKQFALSAHYQKCLIRESIGLTIILMSIPIRKLISR